MVWATPADMLARFDARLIGDLVSDVGVPTANPLTDANLAALLDDSTGVIDSALFYGARYTTAQLADLSASALSFLRRLCCDLTLIYLKRRRGRYDPEKDGALQKEVDARLLGLRNGENLLMLEEATVAPASTVELVRPEMIGVKRSQTIRDSVSGYYPWNPDRDGYSGSSRRN